MSTPDDMPDQTPPPGLHATEAAFHDRWAAESRLEPDDMRRAFEAITAQENRFILGLLPSLQGLRVLDVGTGLGESALYFASRGARVTALDISPGMIDLLARTAERFGLQVEGRVCAAESLGVPDGTFDVVYAANLIHHVQDRDRFYAGVQKALAPGGLFVAWDPIAYNPAINVYRRIATKVRTDDEMPLYFSEFDISRKYFPDLQHREFWLTTLALFFKYVLIDRFDPNKVRYWKKILEETPGSIGRWFSPLAALDGWLLSLPLVRRLAWNTVQWGTRPR